MNQPERALLERIHAYILGVTRGQSTVVESGPFDLLLHKKLTVPWGSAGVPRLGAQPSATDIARAAKEFVDRDRTPRWEFIAELFPGLAEELADGGFGGPTYEPLLVLDPDSLPAPGSGPEAMTIRTFDVSRDPATEVVDMIQIAFGDAADPAGVEAFLTTVAEPNTTQLVAFIDDRAVASGRLAHHAGVGEITGVAVAEPARRQGIGSALTRELAATGVEAGCEVVYLTARDAAAARIYERLGFVKIGSYVEVESPGAS
jgi:ribosomal protein S18 acetylase RimI-like enzyme